MKNIPLMLLIIALLSFESSATTCIPGKPFKVRQVCGQVTDSQDAVIPGASIEITDESGKKVIARSKSDATGNFAIQDLPSGSYWLRVRAKGMWAAYQEFRLERPQVRGSCETPIVVVLKPAGQCSYVKNGFIENR